jgi:hypothetical protein
VPSRRRSTQRQLVIEQFPGLDLRAPLFGKHAHDLRNVIFDENGGVRQRDGYQLWQSGGALGIVRQLLVFGDGITSASRLLVTTSANAKAFDSTGTLLTTYTPASSFGLGSQRGTTFGTPSSARAYIGSDRTWIRYDTTAGFTEPTVSKRNALTGALTSGLAGPAACGFQTWQDRLVAGGWGIGSATEGPAGMASSPSKVWFSEPGDPETWRDSDFVELAPGDNEQVMAMMVWRDLLFVFKRSKFFVFYGIQSNPDGSVRFLRREFKGHGIASRVAVSAGPDGVYFSNWAGLWRSRGGEPEKLSQAIDPVYRQGPFPGLFGGDEMKVDGSEQTVTCCGNYVYVHTGQNVARMYVYDRRYGWWSYWDNNPYLIATPGAVMMSGPGGIDAPDTMAPIWVGNGNGNLYILQPGAMANDNTFVNVDFLGSLTSHYYGGFYALAGDQQVRVRSIRVTGKGIVDVGLRTDFTSNALRLQSGVAMASSTGASLGDAYARQNQWLARHAAIAVRQPTAGSTSGWVLNRAVINSSGGKFDEATYRNIA